MQGATQQEYSTAFQMLEVGKMYFDHLRTGGDKGPRQWAQEEVVDKARDIRDFTPAEEEAVINRAVETIKATANVAYEKMVDGQMDIFKRSAPEGETLPEAMARLADWRGMKTS